MMTEVLKKEIKQIVKQATKEAVKEALFEFLTNNEISKAEAARILKVSERTIHRWIKSGKMKENKNGKIAKEEVLKQLANL
jgi:excisionase family DNA binding protein